VRLHWLGRLGGAYRDTALITFNVVVLIVAANLVLGGMYVVRDREGTRSSPAEAEPGHFREDGSPVKTPKRTSYQMRWFDYRAFEGTAPEFVSQVLDEFSDLAGKGFVYRPWVQFSEPTFAGRLVNVDMDELGFHIRRTINDHDASDHALARVFVLGGSTTFGYNVADQHTWPSYLSRMLNERARSIGSRLSFEVVNYGRGYYYPGQQVVLLMDLLRAGHRPSLVIFMDGINSFVAHDAPAFTREVAAAFTAAQHARPVTAGEVLNQLHWIPMVRLSRSLSTRLSSEPQHSPMPADTRDGDGDSAGIEWAVNQFVHSAIAARAICQGYGCQTMFFQQPHPLYHYDIDLYRPALQPLLRQRVGPVAALYERLSQAGEYIDLSGLFEVWGSDRRAIIDDLHYSPGFNALLARRVADEIRIETLPIFDQIIDHQGSTRTANTIGGPPGDAE
jgi:hypothetical protein